MDIASGLEEVGRLAADIDAIMTRKPERLGSDVLWIQPQAIQPEGRGARRTAAGRHRGRDQSADQELSEIREDQDFDWNGEDFVPVSAPAHAAAERAAGWVKKAKRQRLAGVARAGASWMVTFVLGGAVVAGSLYVLLGRLPGLDELVKLGQIAWM